MDTGTLALLIPVLALAIGLAAILKMPRKTWGAWSGPADPQLENRVAALEQELSSMRQQLVETQERLDFAERILARPEAHRQLDKA